MPDACCGPGSTQSGAEPEAGPRRWWQVRELQVAALAAVLLGVAWLAELVGASIPVVLGLELVAAVLAASTFVPAALRNLRHRRIGVGTLMTIAAIGSVALGQVAEAALLGVLFSIAEGLEHYAVVRTRRGLRALLGLVPPTASVLRDGREVAGFARRAADRGPDDHAAGRAGRHRRDHPHRTDQPGPLGDHR